MDISKYTYNLQVKKVDSYFNEDKKVIDLKIAVPKENSFSFVKAYYLNKRLQKKAIVIHITDNTRSEICNIGIKDLLKVKIRFSDVITASGDSFDLNNKDELYVFVINDHPSDLNSNIQSYIAKLKRAFNDDGFIWGCKNDVIKNSDKGLPVNPEEAGGGVIVTGP